MKPVVNRSFIDMNGFGAISKLRMVIIMRSIIINNHMKPIQRNEQFYDYSGYSELWSCVFLVIVWSTTKPYYELCIQILWGRFWTCFFLFYFVATAQLDPRPPYFWGSLDHNQFYFTLLQQPNSTLGSLISEVL